MRGKLLSDVILSVGLNLLRLGARRLVTELLIGAISGALSSLGLGRCADGAAGGKRSLGVRPRLRVAQWTTRVMKAAWSVQGKQQSPRVVARATARRIVSKLCKCRVCNFTSILGIDSGGYLRVFSPSRVLCVTR